MARHLRLAFEGAINHVTSRGNERSDIFADVRDKERFLGLTDGSGFGHLLKLADRRLAESRSLG
jgi:hypothetical protein